LRDTLAVGIEDADVGYCARRQVAKLHLEAVGVLAWRQHRETTASVLIRQDALEFVAPRAPKGVEVEHAGGRTEPLLEAARESDDDAKPQWKATSVKDPLGAWDIKYSARSSRSRFTN